MALKEMTAQAAFQKLAALCAKGEHCEHDLLEKMRQWGVSEEHRAQVMAQLVSGKYVDDERFCRAFVRDKVLYNHWGRRKVEQALWLKHVNEDTIRAALDEVDDETYAGVLRPLLRQKQKTIMARSDYERRMKLVKWAMGRGFTMDIIRRCIEVDDEDEFLD